MKTIVTTLFLLLAVSMADSQSFTSTWKFPVWGVRDTVASGSTSDTTLPTGYIKKNNLNLLPLRTEAFFNRYFDRTNDSLRNIGYIRFKSGALIRGDSVTKAWLSDSTKAVLASGISGTISSGNLPTNIVYNDQTNTFTSSGTIRLNNGKFTMKTPNGSKYFQFETENTGLNPIVIHPAPVDTGYVFYLNDGQTVTAGIWQGTAIDTPYGGTGATTANGGLNNLLPPQGGNGGKVLGTDGSNTSWTTSGLTSTLTNTHIFVGNASNIATDVAMSADATMANTGALTIATGAVTTGKILDGTILREDVASAFKAPYADTADYADTAGFVASAVPSGAAGGALSGTYPNPTIDNGSISILKLNTTGSPSATTFLRGDSSWATAGGSHNILSATHTDASAASAVRGDVIVANSTPAWARVAKGTASQVFMMNSGATDPAWTTFLFNSNLDGLDASPLAARIYFQGRVGSGVGLGFDRPDAQTMRMNIQDAASGARGLIQATGSQTLSPSFTFEGNNTYNGTSTLSGGAHLQASSVGTGSQTTGAFDNYREFTTTTNMTVTLASAASSVGVPQTVAWKGSVIGTRMLIGSTVSGDASIRLSKSGDYISVNTTGAVNGWRVTGGISHGKPIYPVDNGYQEQTTTATPKVIDTVLIDASTTTILIATVGARRTGGVAGSAEDGAAYKFVGAYKAVGGTATLIGAIQNVITAQEDQAGWDATFTVSGLNVMVSVTGATDNNIDWNCWVEILKTK